MDLSFSLFIVALLNRLSALSTHQFNSPALEFLEISAFQNSWVSLIVLMAKSWKTQQLFFSQQSIDIISPSPFNITGTNTIDVCNQRGWAIEKTFHNNFASENVLRL